MQGRLREGPLTIEIETACSHCNQAIHISLDSEMNVSVHEERADPLVFMPQIDWKNFREPSIVEAY